MLWTCVVILQALSVLSERTSSEYLSPILEKLAREDEYIGDKGNIPQNIFDGVSDEEDVEPSDHGLPTSYFYIAQEAVRPSKRNCLMCLIPLLKEPNSVDPCRCLPCSIKITNSSFTLAKNLLSYYQQFTCDSQKLIRDDSSEDIESARDEKNRFVKFVEEHFNKEPKRRKHKQIVPTVQSYGREEQERTRNYKIEIKMEGDDDSLRPTLQPQLGILFRNFDNNTENEGEASPQNPVRKKVRKNKVNGSEKRRSENSETSDWPHISTGSQKKCLTEDCEIENADAEKENSPLNVSPELEKDELKQKVRRVFNEILTKMEKMNAPLEIEKRTETLPAVPMRRTGFFPISDDEKRRGGLDMYLNPYQRPTYQVLKTRDKKNNFRKIGNPGGSEEEHKLKHTSSPRRGRKEKSNRKAKDSTNDRNETDKTTKSKIRKSKKSRGGEKEPFLKSSVEDTDDLRKALTHPSPRFKMDYDSADGTDSDGFNDPVKILFRGKYSPIKWEEYDEVNSTGPHAGVASAGKKGLNDEEEQGRGRQVAAPEVGAEAPEGAGGIGGAGGAGGLGALEGFLGDADEEEGDKESVESEEESEEEERKGILKENVGETKAQNKLQSKKGRNNKLTSQLQKGTTPPGMFSAGAETKNTLSEDDSDHKSTTPLEPKFSTGESISSGISQPTTVRLDPLSATANKDESKSSENNKLSEDDEKYTTTKHVKHGADSKVVISENKTQDETTKEPFITTVSTTQGSPRTEAVEPSKSNKTRKISDVTTERPASPTYGDRLTMRFPRKNPSRSTTVEGPTTSSPDILSKRNNLKMLSHHTKFSDNPDEDEKIWSEIHVLPDRAEDKPKDRSTVISARNLGDYGKQMSEKRESRLGKRSTRSYLQRTTESPFRADYEDWDGARGWEYANPFQMSPSWGGKSIEKESGRVSDEKPKFVIEFEEEPRKKATDPLINIRLNIYSDTDPDSVYRFLSRLIPRSAERSHDYQPLRRPPRKYPLEPPYLDFGNGYDNYKFLFPSEEIPSVKDLPSRKGGR